MQWLSRSSVLRVGMLMLAVVISGFMLSMFARVEKSPSLEEPLKDQVVLAPSSPAYLEYWPRLHSYCNANIPPATLNNVVEPAQDWKLKYLAINIRHGDRSAIHHTPGTYKIDPLKHEFQVEPRASRYVSYLQSFNLTSLSSPSSAADASGAHKEVISICCPFYILPDNFHT
jgi:hypothetical protein